MNKKILFFILALFLVYPGNSLAALCGDGARESFEECDNGENNSDSRADACRTDCTRARCGDGTVDSSEECDDATYGNSDKIPDACRTNCRRAHCGDGILDSNEECDDKNTNAYDGCHQCSECYLPKDDLVITSAPGQTIKLCPGRYEFVDEGQEGIIIITGSGAKVDCTGVSLIGLPPTRESMVQPIAAAQKVLTSPKSTRLVKRGDKKTTPPPTTQTPSPLPRSATGWQGTAIVVKASDVVLHDSHIEGFQTGIKLSSSGTVLFNNSLRDNGLDIKNENPQNFGVKNRCSKQEGWKENGKDGCTYSN